MFLPAHSAREYSGTAEKSRRPRGPAATRGALCPRQVSYLPRLAPYFDRLRLRPSTPRASSVPRTMWYRTPGRSRTRPPRTSTMLCSWRLCSSPGMYAVTSLPLLSRTRAILRRAELGFLGVMVLTWRHTPRFCGEASKSLTLLIRPRLRRGFLMSWLIVGIAKAFPSRALQPHTAAKFDFLESGAV